MTTSEVEVIDPELSAPEGPIELTNGLLVDVNRLKTRETMKLLKILTTGAGYALSQLSLGADSEDFAEALVLSMALAIPEASEQTIDFIKVMVTPTDLVPKPKSKPEKEVNAALEEQLEDALDNPELEDLIAIVTRIVQVEAPHIQALGKHLSLLLKAYRPEQS